jgi:starch synthase
VALSPHVADLARRGGADRNRIVVIPNGIDAEDFGLDPQAPWSAPTSTGTLRLLFVGRLAVEKGVQVLVEALGELGQAAAHVSVEIIGGGPLESSLTARAKSLKKGDIVFSGSIPRRSLAAKYLDAHVVCVPSLSDTLPSVALEAARAGRAVLGSAIGGLTSIVQEGVTGVLVPAGSPAALAEALRGFIADRGQAIRMGKAARERAVAEYSWSSVGSQLKTALDRALAAPHEGLCE